jgi:uncharacterized protein YlbG (UPF0298 family)
MDLIKIKNIIQDCNLNFLLGSGLSFPYLKTLGNIETLLSDLEEEGIEARKKDIIRASIYARYFKDIIVKNREMHVSSDHPLAKKVASSYQEFLRNLNLLLLKRKSTIIGKEINLFTTNIDIFIEKSLEKLNFEYNDGFNGRFQPVFDLSNFKKSHFKKSLHYDNVSELPVFNLIKLHGSLTWKKLPKKIVFSRSLSLIKEVEEVFPKGRHLIKTDDTTTMADMLEKVKELKYVKSIEVFMREYEKLQIVNPTKHKFHSTTINQIYYELLRIYSNELEKENTVLFALGFSFSDEHIREITIRALNSNPTLIVYIFAYNEEAYDEISSRFPREKIRNHNLVIINPEENGAEEKPFDFETINQIFSEVLRSEKESFKEENV